MKQFKEVRHFVTYVMEMDGHYFKVWECADGHGYWVEEMARGGEKVDDNTYWAGSKKHAAQLAEEHLAKYEVYMPSTAGCAEGNCVEPELCANHKEGK